MINYYKMNKYIKIVAFLFIPILFFTASSCKKSDSATVKPIITLPVLTCEDVAKPRMTTAGLMRFIVGVDIAPVADASATFSVVAGTALSPKNFTATTGTVTFAAGQNTAYIDVAVTGDSLRQADLQFTVQFSDPKNCTLGTTTAKGTIGTMDGTYLTTNDAGYVSPASYVGYTLVWSDEFTGNTINTGFWNFETGGNGWGNHELENYTNRAKNSFQSNGKLIIEARSEQYNGNNYTSAKMTTQGKKAFTFGRIDIRAKLPVTKGMWPALWMLGSNISTINWPSCGEIDMMELIGTYPGKIFGTGHYADNASMHQSKGGNVSLNGEDFSQNFHVFSIIWVKDSIQWLLDDKVYFTMDAATAGSSNYPFNKDFFFIFNVAVGGDWPGAPDASTGFPQRMFVDYVRVFQ